MHDLHEERPPAMAAWQREVNARVRRHNEMYPYPAEPPEAVLRGWSEAAKQAFAAAWSTLSGAERAAEFSYLNTRLREDPVGAYTEVAVIKALMSFVNASEPRTRSSVEAAGIVAAQDALRRCRYMGGFAAYPKPAETFEFVCGVGRVGELQWLARRAIYVAVADWPDVREMRVGPTDRSPERLTATRAAAVGVFAFRAKKPRREAMLTVRTTRGEGIFIVHGRTPLEVRAALAPLVSRLGQATSDEFTMSTGIDDALFANARAAYEANLAAQLARSRASLAS